MLENLAISASCHELFYQVVPPPGPRCGFADQETKLFKRLMKSAYVY